MALLAIARGTHQRIREGRSWQLPVEHPTQRQFSCQDVGGHARHVSMDGVDVEAIGCGLRDPVGHEIEVSKRMSTRSPSMVSHAPPSTSRPQSPGSTTVPSNRGPTHRWRRALLGNRGRSPSRCPVADGRRRENRPESRRQHLVCRRVSQLTPPDPWPHAACLPRDSDLHDSPHDISGPSTPRRGRSQPRAVPVQDDRPRERSSG